MDKYSTQDYPDCQSIFHASQTAYLHAQTSKAHSLLRVNLSWDNFCVGRPFPVPVYALLPYSLPGFSGSWCLDPSSFPTGIHSLFARPCPIKPRHGFVDSVTVHTITDTFKLYEEARKLDAQAELLLSPAISSSSSMVLTSNGATRGKENDGATRGDQIEHKWLLHGYRPRWHHAPHDVLKPLPSQDVYIETVNGRIGLGNFTRNYIVQWRFGPKAPSGLDYIPNPVEVTKVVKLSATDKLPDLFAWEKRLNTLRKDNRTGLVIEAPEQSLSSHYAVHAIVNGIPFITTKSVKIGDKLEPIETMSQMSNSLFRELWMDFDVAKGREAVESIIESYSGQQIWNADIDLGLSIFSLLPLTDPDPILYKGFIQGMVALVHAAMLSGFGEIRYWIGSQISEEPLPNSLISRMHQKSYDIEFGDGNDTVPRSVAYTQALNTWPAWSEFGEVFIALAEAFGTKEWKRNNTIGGPKWRAAVLTALDLWQALERPDPTLPEVLAKANLLVNAVHNGGRFLNKLITEQHMEQAAALPHLVFTNPHFQKD